MPLMDAPAFDEKKEKQRVHLLIGALIAVVLIIAIALGGFFAGHGWFFSNVPAELRVNSFLKTVEAGDFQKAYGIWMHDDSVAAASAEVRLQPAAVHRGLVDEE